MGGATDICSDKTGTLTENRMAVVAGWLAGKRFSKVSTLSVPKEVKATFMQSLCVNINDGQLVETENSSKSITSSKTLTAFKFVGSTTECALLVLAQRFGIDYQVPSALSCAPLIFQELQGKFPKVHRWNFSSARKRMSTVVAHPEKKGQCVVLPSPSPPLSISFSRVSLSLSFSSCSRPLASASTARARQRSSWRAARR
jgi:magnesium-transporting ATPase (P-type)